MNKVLESQIGGIGGDECKYVDTSDNLSLSARRSIMVLTRRNLSKKKQERELKRQSIMQDCQLLFVADI